MVRFKLLQFKGITICLLSLFLLFGLALLAYNHLVPTLVSGGDALMIRYYTVEDLEERADLIVMVTVIGSGREEVMDDSSTFFANTFTPVRVEKAYKGDVNPGDVIEVAEFIYSRRTPTGLEIVTVRPYKPLERKKSYLLFLTKTTTKGWWRLTGESQGKYVWPMPSAITPRNLEIMEIDDDFRQLYQQVFDKYHGAD